MKNKVLVKVILPELETNFDLYIPINVRIYTVIKLLNDSLSEITKGEYVMKDNRNIYNIIDGVCYKHNSLIRETNIRNGSTVIFI